jgi:hypothetical protein
MEVQLLTLEWWHHGCGVVHKLFSNHDLLINKFKSQTMQTKKIIIKCFSIFVFSVSFFKVLDIYGQRLTGLTFDDEAYSRAC